MSYLGLDKTEYPSDSIQAYTGEPRPPPQFRVEQRNEKVLRRDAGTAHDVMYR